MYDFKFADIGEGIHEGKILEWKFKVGDKVKEGETIVIVETDKVNAELPSPVSGTITKLGKKEGDIITVGETVVIIDDGSNKEIKETKKDDLKEASKDEKEAGATVIGEIEVSSDIIEPSSEAQTTVAPKTNKALATPVARNLAKQLGVDINVIPGTGPQGRVMKKDIEEFAKPQETLGTVPQVTISQDGDVRVEDISSIRKTISKAMTTSKTIIPETTLFDDVLIDKLVELRNRTKPLAEERGISLTYLAFISKAVIIALKEFPILNSSFDHNNNQIIYKNFINLGFAVDTPNGLIVPNIKNAQHQSIFDLASNIKTLATKAIDRTIQLDEIQNGTFTITNFGSVGISYGVPIINHPEVAILGIGRISKKAVVVDDEIKVGHVLPLSLAVDHRIIDGADAGRFLMRVKQLLSEPDLMMLGWDKMKNYDLIIVGGGPGGYVAAIKAAQENLKVALIEKDAVGGICLNHGCIPTKTILKSAQTYLTLKSAADHGINVKENSFSFEMEKIIKRKDDVVKRLTSGVSMLLKKNKVDVYNGYGTIINKNEVKVNDETLKGKNIIIATGATAVIPPIKGAQEAYKKGYVITSKEALKITKVPKKIVIIGGGIIGIEFATIFNAFEADVTIIEMADSIINSMDDDIINEYSKKLLRDGIKIINNAKVTEIGVSNVTYNKDNKEEKVEADLVLMAVGVKPNIDSFKDLGVNLNEFGVDVDKHMETNIKGVYAIGDVIGKQMLAHVASKEALVAIDNILGKKTEMDYKSVPSVVYGFPEIASVGLTEKEAKKQNLNFKVSKFPLMASGKAMADGKTIGLVKIIKGTDLDEILGAHILSHNASDLIGELVVGINSELTNFDLADAIHPHPSLSEAIMEAAMDKPIHM